MHPSISQRIEKLDWSSLRDSLWEFGYAQTGTVLTVQECTELINLYSSDARFRSHIIMARYRFGRGDYKYFNYPLPEIVQELRERSYPHLAKLAGEWIEALGLKTEFPERLADFLALCKKHKQVRATPLLLHYEAGDFNCLHQDLYGEIAFPLQMTCFLSRVGRDYEGGEFVL